MQERVVWTYEEAFIVIRDLIPKAKEAGFCLALTGSVLLTGESKKDLDLVVFPLKAHDYDHEKFYALLVSLGWKLSHSREEVVEAWKMKGQQDSKHVEVWRNPESKRVDLFFLK